MDILFGESNQIPACIEIGKQLPQYFTNKAIRSMFEDFKNHDLFVALESNQILGFITYFKKNAKAAELSWLAVHPQHHHKGIGTKLVEHVLTILKDQGVKHLEVKTLAKEANYPPYEITRNFFEKLGFIHKKTIDAYPGWDPGNPCAIYVREI